MAKRQVSKSNKILRNIWLAVAVMAVVVSVAHIGDMAMTTDWSRWWICLGYWDYGTKMRRFKQLLDERVSKDILKNATNGALSLVDSDGNPYGVAMSYVYDGDGCIYFHSAVTGHKIECIEADSRCSFCVVSQNRIVPDEFTTYFRSVIVKGTVHVVMGRDEMIKGLMLLCGKYSPVIALISANEISPNFTLAQKFLPDSNKFDSTNR